MLMLWPSGLTPCVGMKVASSISETCWPHLRGQHGCGESVVSLGRQDDMSCAYSDTI